MLSIYPTANAYYELGNVYLHTKKWSIALQSFEMAEAMNFTPSGNVLFGQASCYAEMDSTEKIYSYLTYAVHNGFVDRAKILTNPHFATYKNDDMLLTSYNEAMSGTGDPEEILWQGYTQDFKQASFPYKLDSAHKIIDYTKGQTFDAFTTDNKTIDAVIRNFEIIGEAANRLPDAFRDTHTSIDWARIKGFRNRIVHDYFGIDYSIVWQIKESFLPQLIQELNRIDPPNQ